MIVIYILFFVTILKRNKKRIFVENWCKTIKNIIFTRGEARMKILFFIGSRVELISILHQQVNECSVLSCLKLTVKKINNATA